MASLEPSKQFLLDIKRCVGWIERGVKERDSKFIARALRFFAPLRHKLPSFGYLLPELANTYIASPALTVFTREALNGLDLNKPSEPRDVVMGQNTSPSEETMDVEVSMDNESSWTHIYSREVEVFIGLICMMYLLMRKELNRGLALSDAWIKVLLDENRRSLDLLAARIYFFFARFYELSGNMTKIRG